jgi:tmRNA-binding protein
MSKSFTVVSNRKAFYEYHVLQEFEAGVMLTGSEVKSLRDGKVNVGDAYCSFTGGQLTITKFGKGLKIRVLPLFPWTFILGSADSQRFKLPW